MLNKDIKSTMKTSKRDSIKSAIGLTTYFISLPPTRYLILAILFVGFVFGLIIDFGKFSPSESYLQRAFLDGLILLTLPALLSVSVIKLMIRKMPSRRIVATALAGQVVYGLAYASSLLYASTSIFIAELILLVGAALVFVLWYVIARLVFILKYRSVLFAVVQMVFYLLFLLNSSEMSPLVSEPLDQIMTKFSLAAVVLLGALYIFFLIVNAPMKKNFGVSSTDAFTYIISQWLYHNRDLEKAFSDVGTKAKTLVSIIGFKREKDNIFFIVPCVHFGPFGNLGGSEFSHLIAQELDKKHNSQSLVFHGTVTHDLNPVSTSQLPNITNALEECIQNADYKNAKVSLLVGKKEECSAEAIRINNTVFVGLSRAPEVTEDINFGLGLSMMYEAEKNAETAIIVDQHNAETGEVTTFEPGDPVGYRYLAAIAESLSKKSKEEKLRIGISIRNTTNTGNGSLGKAGIKIAVLSCVPEYVIILLDSNGVTPVFREKIVTEVRKLGKECIVGVYTTDTHQINMVRGVVNPLKAEDDVLEDIKKGVKEAREDSREAKFFACKRWFDIDVIGAKQSVEIVSTINSVIAVAKLTLPLLFIVAILIIAVLLKIL